jgi:hypothetical protein
MIRGSAELRKIAEHLTILSALYAFSVGSDRKYNLLKTTAVAVR